MNIKQAKDDIENTVRLYLKKDEFGEYRIPVVRQRPIFLLGAPGIGKTAVMEQIAQELQIALVSYSMTHHTRQSALGLPFISHREYQGMKYDVSEYTMSEIIASIYEVMEKSGIREGILFLDEINCVSETLAPSMLQFLQYKVFGRHKVPEGWVIVTAGNPPEYNKSVREFDVVTLDRLKVLDVEADYRVWKDYAWRRGLHAAILNFLELKKEYFYKIETTVNGRSYVTARGWEDLSEILYLYEEEGMKADEGLVGQYIRNERVVKEFTAYYDLFNKYKKEYQTEEILAGTAEAQTAERARLAAFDERLSLLGMLIDKVLTEIREDMETGDYLVELFKNLKTVAAVVKMENTDSTKEKPSVREMLENQINGRKKQMESARMAGSLSEREKRCGRRILRFMEGEQKNLLLTGKT
ncbi:MAG: AAA family ATPase, partial [Lachnospiraceae bacterium]|nr:AAA family ATPase [Lachnospiraceae bacterium]